MAEKLMLTVIRHKKIMKILTGAWHTDLEEYCISNGFPLLRIIGICKNIL
jgi:hypothetical protein